MSVAATLWLAAASHVALTLVLLRLPLLQQLGYEFAFAHALLAAITSSGIAFAWARRLRQAPQSPWRVLYASAASAQAALLPSLALVLAHGLWQKPCNLLQGLQFWFLQPVLGAAYGVWLILVCLQLPIVAGRPRLRRFFGCAMLGAPLLLGLWRLYREPPIHAYNHLWGYFAGSLFDERIAIDARLLGFRASTCLRLLCLAAALLWPVARKRQQAFFLFAAAVLALGCDAVLGPRLGYAVDRQALQRALPQVVQRGQLFVHMPRFLSDAAAAALADDHAFRWSQLTQLVPQRGAGEVHSWVFATDRDKAFWLGGRQTQVAKPWLREIYIQGTGIPHPILAHELAHVALAPWGAWPLQIPARLGLFPLVGLLEGMAVALAPDDTPLGLQTSARQLEVLGLAAPLEALLSPGILAPARAFWQHPPERVYLQTGAFVQHLQRRFGMAPLLAAYAQGDLAAATHTPLQTLLQEYSAAQQQIATPAPQRARIASAMQRSSIFVRTCPHEVARLQDAMQGASPQARVALQRQILAFSPQAPQQQLRLANLLRQAAQAPASVWPQASTAAAADVRQQEAEQLELALLAQDDLDVACRAGVLDAQSQAAALRGDDAKARALCADGMRLPLAAWQRQFWLRQLALDLPALPRATLLAVMQQNLLPAAHILALSQLAQGADAQNHALAAMAHYLLGRALYAEGSFAAASASFALASPLPFAPVAQEAARLAALSAWRTGALGEAQAALLRYQKSVSAPQAQIWAADFAARLAWQGASAVCPTDAPRL